MIEHARPERSFARRAAGRFRWLRSAVAVALVMALAMLAGCSGKPAKVQPARAAAPAPTASPVAGLSDVGAGVLLDTTVADGAEANVASGVRQPYAYEQLSEVYQVSVVSQPTAGARLAIPVRRAYDVSTDVPVVLVSNSVSGPWQPLAGTLVPGGQLVSAVTPHFSFFTAILVPVTAVIAELTKIFNEATSGALAEAKAPSCAKEKQARTQGWSVASTGQNTVQWCLGVAAGGSRYVTLVNNRRYPLSVAHPGGVEVARSDSASELASYAKFASPGRTLLLPRDRVSYTLTGSAKVRTEFDGSAQSLYALQVGVELAFAFLTKFGLVGNIDKGLSVALQSTKCVTVLQDIGQTGRILRDCFDPAMLRQAFGQSGLFLAAIMTVAPVAEFFRSSLNALGDQFNGRDRYGVNVTYIKPIALPTPALDSECQSDSVTVALCRFVVAATARNLASLREREREPATRAAELPKRRWSITSCELEGDITVLCEIEYEGTPNNREPTSAGFYLALRTSA